VSNVKGGINVLIDMNYPREIIDSATKKWKNSRIHSFVK
jgi:hypothetical protein